MAVITAVFTIRTRIPLTHTQHKVTCTYQCMHVATPHCPCGLFLSMLPSFAPPSHPPPLIRTAPSSPCNRPQGIRHATAILPAYSTATCDGDFHGSEEVWAIKTAHRQKCGRLRRYLMDRSPPCKGEEIVCFLAATSRLTLG